MMITNESPRGVTNSPLTHSMLTTPFDAPSIPSPPREQDGRTAVERALDRIFDLLEDKKLRFVDLFRTLDRDHSGYVEAAELHAAFRRHGIAATAEEVGELLYVLDANGDNRIAYSEFLPKIRKLQIERRRRAANRHLLANSTHDNGWENGTNGNSRAPPSQRQPARGNAVGAPVTDVAGRLTETRESRVARQQQRRLQSQQQHVERVRSLQHLEANAGRGPKALSFEQSLRIESP